MHTFERIRDSFAVFLGDEYRIHKAWELPDAYIFSSCGSNEKEPIIAPSLALVGKDGSPPQILDFEDDEVLADMFERARRIL